MLSSLGKFWNLSSIADEAGELSKSLQVSPIMGHLLWQRGFKTVDAARSFLDPRLQGLSDPLLLTGLASATERIWQAIDRNERVVIFGDYDVDGITSSALLWRVLKKLGATVETFLPHRMDEGYGLSQEGVERCVEQFNPQLLIAVDCGTTAVESIAWLRKKGVDVVVVDHHALPPQLPDCQALVNPQRDGVCTYLASVGLVFKLCHGLLKTRGIKEQVDLRDYLDLVSVGTVADIVPLRDENRILVRRGLQQLAQSSNPGLRALCQITQIRGVPSTSDVAFRIGPRLNASGRLGDATRSLALLKTDDVKEAQKLADELDRNNRERQGLEQTTLEEALAVAEATYDPASDWSLVLAGHDWHVGVIGIVASRLLRIYNRPTIIIGFDEDGVGKGSGRSIDGFSIIDGLRVCEKHLQSFGGHEMAAGLHIAQPSIDSFRDAFNKHVRSVLKQEDLQPSLTLAGEIPLASLDESLFHELQQLAPFGRENPEPIFLFRRARFRRPPRLFGKNHFKIFLETAGGECEAVAFGLANHNLPGDSFDLAGVLDWDDYNNRLQIRLLDWRAPI
jgi:single-stranded-DNA-specific exonuclease